MTRPRGRARPGAQRRGRADPRPRSSGRADRTPRSAGRADRTPRSAAQLARTDRVKRIVDVVLTTIGVVLLAPLFVVLAWRVRREFGSPVLFRQPRPGLHGEVFELRKFRTMTDERDADGALLPDEQRLTRFGRWLRSTSLDELPEMWNVLRGDMSLVGPRPLLVAYLEHYTPEQARRHEVRPGITGWAQVNGRNDMSWPEKLAQDVWYVDNRSLWLDVKILLRTLWVMVRREGVSLDGHATTVRFDEVAGGTDGSDRTDRPDLPYRPDRPGRADRPDRPDHEGG